MEASRRLPHDWFARALPANVAIGERSYLYSSFAFLHCRSAHPLAVAIGRSSGVYAGSFFDLGPRGRVSIGDFSTLVGVIVATNGDVAIGDYCFLAHEVVIADVAAATPWRDDARETDPPAGRGAVVTLGDDVWIGAGAVLLAGARIGSGAVVGAASVVDFAVPERAVVAGNPARIVGKARAPRASRGAGSSP